MNTLDFHNHLMPNVDDGAQSLEESCRGLSAFQAEGVNAVITTPHFDASLTLAPELLSERLAELDAAWTEVSHHARSHHPGLLLERGVELMLDIPHPNLADRRLRLAGGPFVLIEFPYMTVPPRSAETISTLHEGGTLPILAHPERYDGFTRDFSLAEQWKRAGAYLQVNGGSLLGRYGPEAQRFACGLIERGWADYLCSDYHARGTLGVSAYQELLTSADAEEHVHLLCEVNPRRVLAGETPLPVPALAAKRTFWGRVSGLFSAR